VLDVWGLDRGYVVERVGRLLYDVGSCVSCLSWIVGVYDVWYF
jgi:hypothetical protein